MLGKPLEPEARTGCIHRAGRKTDPAERACTNMNITISNKARGELQRRGVGGPCFMRISVVSGGCSGMTYIVSIDSARNPGDRLVFDDGNVRVFADPASLPYLDGLEIDYSDDLIRSGFRFANPKARHSCGCGASFSV